MGDQLYTARVWGTDRLASEGADRIASCQGVGACILIERLVHFPVAASEAGIQELVAEIERVDQSNSIHSNLAEDTAMSDASLVAFLLNSCVSHLRTCERMPAACAGVTCAPSNSSPIPLSRL